MRGLREFFRNPSGWNRVLGGVGVVVAFVLVVALAFVGIQGTVGYAFANAPRYVLSDAYTQYVSPGSPSAIENFSVWLLPRLAALIVALVVIGWVIGWLVTHPDRRSLIWKGIKAFCRHPFISTDRILSSGVKSQLFLLAGFILLVLVIFIAIEWATDSVLTIKEGGDRNLWFDVYYHFVDPGNQYVVNGGGNRLLVSIVSITGSVLMGGLLISIISNMIDRRVEHAREGQLKYKFKRHYVIIGFDKMAIGLIKQLFRKIRDDARFKNEPYLFVIQTTSEVETVRHELLSKLDDEIDRRTIILHGGRDSREDLERLRLPYCQEIFLLGEEGETDHDSINIECVTLINRILLENKKQEEKPRDIDMMEKAILREQEKRKKCHVLFEAQSTFAVFQRNDIETVFKKRTDDDDSWYRAICALHKNDQSTLDRLKSLKKDYDEQTVRLIDFLPFNFYETWAEKVLVWGKYDPHNDGVAPIVYPPLDGGGIDYESDRYVHLVIVGMTSMGVALAMKAAHIAHYPNFVRDPKLKTRITFIDLNADTEFDMLRGRYSALFEQCDYRVVDTLDDSRSYEYKGTGLADIEFEFVKGAIESRPVQKLLESWTSAENRSLLTIAICFEVPQKSIATALYMPQKVYKRALSILVRQNVSCSTIELVRQARQYNGLRAFGMLDECYDIDDSSLLQAKRVNFIYGKKAEDDKQWEEEMNQRKENGEKIDRIEERELKMYDIDDMLSNELWKSLTMVHRWSNIYNAHSIPTKRRSFGLEEPENLLANKDLLEKMAQVEHNRWVIERLIQGYRPTTPEEDKLVEIIPDRVKSKCTKKIDEEDKREWQKRRRKKLERRNFAHYCLKPYKELGVLDKDNDRSIMAHLWRISKPLAE